MRFLVKMNKHLKKLGFAIVLAVGFSVTAPAQEDKTPRKPNAPVIRPGKKGKYKHKRGNGKKIRKNKKNKRIVNYLIKSSKNW